MPEVEFVNLFAVVLEIVAGIVVGPSVLGWVDAVLPVQIVSLLGPAFLTRPRRPAPAPRRRLTRRV